MLVTRQYTMHYQGRLFQIQSLLETMIQLLTGIAEDERSIANRLAREEQRERRHEEPVNPEAELSKQDPTKVVCTRASTLCSNITWRAHADISKPGRSTRKQPFSRRRDRQGTSARWWTET